MAEDPGTSPRLDRIRRPDPSRHRPRDAQGKEALYSTAPSASPPAQIDARCRRCGVALGLTVVELVRLLRLPFLWDPVRDRLWTRCPACRRRSWLEVRVGQALRVLLERAPR